MAITNAEMAEAWGELLGLTPEKITNLTALLDQWALGGARVTTWSRLATDLNLFNNAAVAMVHDWYGGEATGGPNGDGLYPLMNSEGEVALVPSPAKIMAGVSALDPKGELASEDDLPATGAAGQLWIVGGDAFVWSATTGAWVNMGLWRGPQGLGGTITNVTLDLGAPGSAAAVALGGTPEARTIGLTVPAAADGVTPNVSFEIVMVAHGEAATVVQSGTVQAPHLIFNIPSPLPGVDGKNIEIQKTATHVQWRRVGDVAWVDLVALTDLMVKGDKGDPFAFDAKPANLAARAAYDAEADGFTVLVMDTGTVYARIGATAGVWSDGFAFGQAQNAILEALSELNATAGVLVQTGATIFAKRAIGAASDSDLLDRAAADERYLQAGDPVALADVTGLAAALDDKANAAAVIALLAQKADATATTNALALKADLVGGKVPAGQLPAPPTVPGFATKEEVWAGTATNKIIPPSVLKAAAEPVAATGTTGAITLDFNAGFNWKLAATGNITLANPTNKQDRSFSLTVTLPNAATVTSVGPEWKRSPGSVAIPTAANAKFDLVCRATPTEVQYSVVVLA